MKRGEIALVFNTPEDGRARKDSYLIRRTAVTQNIPYYLTVDGAQAAIGGIEALLKGEHRGAQPAGVPRMPRADRATAGDRAAPSRSTSTGPSSDAEAGPARSPRTGSVERLQDRLAALHRRRPRRRRDAPASAAPRLPRPQVPRHPQHGGGRGARGHAARRVHAQRPRLRRRRDDAGRRRRGREGRGRSSRAAAALLARHRAHEPRPGALLRAELGVPGAVEAHVLRLAGLRAGRGARRLRRLAPGDRRALRGDPGPRLGDRDARRPPGGRARRTTRRAPRRRPRPCRAGADYLVVGRPITGAADPAAAAAAILAEMPQ